jgi:hypothetical protein
LNWHHSKNKFELFDKFAQILPISGNFFSQNFERMLFLNFCNKICTNKTFSGGVPFPVLAGMVLHN